MPAVKTNIETSTVGSLNRAGGFTLIELIVVVSLISMMLFFAVPGFRGGLFSENIDATARWLIANIRNLKETAVRDQKLYLLHLDMDARKIWVEGDSMTEEERSAALEKAYVLPEGVSVADVQYPEVGKIGLGEARIRFYPGGYSDKALIHLTNEDEKAISLLVETFLPQVRLFEEYAEF